MTVPAPPFLYPGVNAALLTPLRADLSPDLDRMAARAAALLAGGCDGLGVLGTTGEANSLSLAQRIAVVEGLVERGVPARRLMPGTGTPSLADTVALSRAAARAGCPGVLMLPPFFYKGPTEDGLFAWYSEVVNRVGEGLSLYLYHFPQHSGVPVTLALVERLLRAFPGVVRGLKDSGGDFAHMAALARAFGPEGFEVHTGFDEFLQPLLAAGGAGCITAGANVNAPLAARVCAERTGPAADAAQAALAATRRAATGLGTGGAMIPTLREIVARETGDAAWRTTLPPHLPLSPAEAETAWTAWAAVRGLLHIEAAPLT